MKTRFSSVTVLEKLVKAPYGRLLREPFVILTAKEVGKLITPNPIRPVVHRIFDLSDHHIVAVVIADLHLHPVAHFVTKDRLSQRGFGADLAVQGISRMEVTSL